MSSKVVPAVQTEGQPKSKSLTAGVVKGQSTYLQAKAPLKPLKPAVCTLQKSSNTEKADQAFPYVQTRDKIMFIISVIDLVLLSFFTGGYHWCLPYYYSLKAVPYLFLRCYSYGRSKYAYFLLDLCYWGNVFLLLYLWLPTYEYSEYFFAFVYSLCTGPMAWAVIIFRNSMVFHSLDKSISNFIHISPLLVVFALRWHSPIAENMWENTTDVAGRLRDVYPHNWTGFGRFKICEIHQPCFENWHLWFFLVPAGAQLLWVLFYALITRACCPLKDHHVDSFRYMTATGSHLQVLGEWKNEKLAYLTYALINYLSNILMTLPAALFYYNYYLNLVLLGGIILASIINGANFYIDIFSQKYISSVKKTMEVDRKERERRQVSP